jgi:hypothetical protein
VLPKIKQNKTAIVLPKINKNLNLKKKPSCLSLPLRKENVFYLFKLA